MLPMLSVVTLGFLLGMRHAVDADHVIAVTTIVSRQRSVRGAMRIGAVWGLGHTLTIMLVGSAIVLFSLTVPPRLGLTLELAVAFMLIVLGVVNLKGFFHAIRDLASGAAAAGRRHAHPHVPGAAEPHAHAHLHGDYVHQHRHGHRADDHGHPEDRTPQAWLDRRFEAFGAYQALRPLVVGVIHGLAGSATIALLVLATIQSAAWAVLYLALFGLGTIVGMMLVTAAVATPIAWTAARWSGFERYARLASGAVSLAFGLFLAYEIGWVDGLFTGAPR